MKIAVITAVFNADVAERLLAGALACFAQSNIERSAIDVISVPGSLEIAPFIARLTSHYDGYIAIGCVIKGETHHFEMVCEGVTYGLQKIAIEKKKPVINCVLMCYKKDQALKRSENSENNALNKGYESASALLSLITLYKKYS